MPSERRHEGRCEQIIDCELCVVGSGVAGLNALHSATRYLRPNDRVILVDARDAPGGMWRDTYGYVRLHQPHATFTVGDITWAKNMPPEYLADRSEVQRQFEHCLVELSLRVNLISLFGHRYHTHIENLDGVEINCERIVDGAGIRVRATRLIKALSYDIAPSRPLSLTSHNIHSLSPHEVDGDSIAGNDAPIVVVGGGKTAMDTAHYLIRRYPNRDVQMIIGRGVMFANRDALFPLGIRRHFGGSTFFEMFLDVARRFDGTNTDDAMEYMHRKYGLGLNDRPRQFQVGLLSSEEMDTIRHGVSGFVEDRLSDVVDVSDLPVMQFASGRTAPIAKGAWFVNCTGYLPKSLETPVEPYISDGGKVLSVTSTSLVFFLGSFSGYFLGHLFYRDLLGRVPLYQVAIQDLTNKGKEHLGLVAVVQTVLNVLLLMRALPLKVFDDCLLDTNRWYPLARRMPILLRYMIRNRVYQEHCRAALDRLSVRIGVPIGPLPRLARTPMTTTLAFEDG